MPLGLTLGNTILDNAVRFADIPAYVGGGVVRSHAELGSRATALASALAGRGLSRQDRIAVLGKNSVEFGEVLASGHLSGLIVATVNYRLALPEIARILRDVAPRVLFCDREFLPAVRGVSMAGLDTVVFGDADTDALAYEDLIAAGDPEVLPFASRADDVACLIYTSGSTGRPKGCILGHREIRALVQTLNVELRSGCDDRVLLSMPMFHIGAMTIGLALHARGGTALLQRQFDPVDTVRAVPDGAVTVLHLAPTMLQAMLDAVPDSGVEAESPLGGVRTVAYSAAPMTLRTLRAALTAMPDAGFVNLYGQTEVITSSLPRELHVDSDDDRTQSRLSSVGYPFPDTEVRILDDAGAAVPRGQAGEIVVRSPSMFRGYWNDSRATAETLRDGWCHTGDIGVISDDGLLSLKDRKKDIVITGGENVYCPEVEDAVAAHPAVVACAVIGIPDERWGEAVCAVVVLAPGATVVAGELRDFVAARLARYAAPRHVIVIDALPLLATGKVDKKALRTRYAAPLAPIAEAKR